MARWSQIAPMPYLALRTTGCCDARGSGALFIVSAALRETGALEMTLGRVLGRYAGTRRSTLRMAIPVAALSGFLNNAPIVAMMTPTVIDWGRRNQVPASKFLIPLSYASILGSLCTVIGTSTILTIVVSSPC